MSFLTHWTLPVTVGTAFFWIALVACGVAQLYILRAVFRVLPALPVSSNVPVPRRWAEVLWAVLPIAGLAAAFWGAWRALSS
jgi:hypothetical protein